MKKEHSYNVLKVLQIIRSLLLIILSITILCSAIVGHCASGDENIIYFPMQQNENNKFPDYLKDYLDTQFDNESNFIFASYSSEEWTYSTKYSYYYVCYFSKQYNDGIPFIYGEIHSNGYEFGLYKLPSYTVSCCRVRMAEVYSSGNISSYTFRINNNYGDNLANFQNFTSSLYSQNSSFVSNFKMYVNNQQNAGLVLKYGADSVPGLTGHATPPDEFEEPNYPTGSQIPSHVPRLTINNYTWTTIPTPDFTTLETTTESIYNYLQWLGSNLMGALTNLVNNLTNIGTFIGETIQYYGNLIVKTIQNGITTFYNNMVSLFEPIASAIDYISQPLQVEEVVTAIQSTDIHTDIVSVVNLSNTAFGIFGTVAEPQNFTIPLDLTGISILHQTQPFYIDLSWIIDARQYIRAFMWCIVTFGLLYSIVIGIPSMLKDGK